MTARPGRIQGGWLLAQESWRVLRADRSLALFPIISALATVAAAAVIWAPVAVIDSGQKPSPVAAYIAVGVSLYVLTFIAVFFGTALAAAVSLSLEGKDTTLGDGLSAATRRLHTILAWSLIQAVVGALLHLLEGLARSRSPLAIVAAIIEAILGAAWGVMTFLVIPILALEGLGPVQTIKRSWELIKGRWGEGLVGSFSIAMMVFLVLVVPVTAIGGMGISQLPAHKAIGIPLVAVAGVISAAGILVSSTLNSIFRVALYRYATSGHVSSTFDQQLITGAFKSS